MSKLLIALLCVLCLCQYTQAQLDFAPIEVLPKDGEANEIRYGDIDGDGDQDVIFSTITKPRIFVLLNLSGILSKEPIPVINELVGVFGGNYSLPFTVGDLDNDGKDEIAYIDIVSNNSNPIKIMKWGGTIFTVATTLPSQHPSARSINAADFNKDGVLDLQIVSDQIYLYLSAPTGGYTEKKFTTPEIFPFKSVVADINNDSFLDLVFFDNASKISIYKNSQNGNFAFDQSITSGAESIKKIIVNDFNNDTRRDIIVLPNASRDFFFYLTQNSNGTFSETKVDVPVALDCVDSFDKNNDGKPDLIFGGQNTTSSSYGLAIMENNGSSFNFSFFHDPALSPRDIICVNLNTTPAKEIATLNFGENIVTFESSTPLNRIQNIPYSYTSLNSILTDLNIDGNLDLVVINSSSSSVAIFYKRDDGEFEAPVYFDTGAIPLGIGSADFNNDDHPDLVFTINSPTSSIGILLNHFTGIFEAPYFLNGGMGANVVTNDFNKDGNMDFFDGTYAFFGNGDGSFTSSLVANNSISFTTGNYNSDEYPDLAIASNSGLSLYLGKNANSFDAGAQVVTTQSIYTLTSSDINGDSKIDIIAGNTNGTISKFLNNNGIFNESAMPISGSATKILFADFDNDNTKDMAVLDNTNTKLLIYTSNGLGDFTFYKEYQTGPYYYNQLLSNYQNNDNYIDLILLNSFTPVSIMLNDFVEEPTLAPFAQEVFDIIDKSGSVMLTVGNGDARLIVIRETANPEVKPTDNVFYTANLSFGLGANIGNSNFAIAVDNVESIEFSGLKEGTEYTLTAYEYSANVRKTIINYLTTTSASITFKTKRNQTIAAISISAKTMGGAPFKVEPTSSSGREVTPEALSTNISIDNPFVSLISPGLAKIKFYQEGDDDFLPAPDVQVSFCVNPQIPTITQSSSGIGKFILTSSSNTNNIWLKNGEAIAGAVNKTYEPTQDGIYSVKVDYEGCSNTSLPTAHIITGIENLHESLSFYPNPASDQLFIEWPKQNPKIDRILILDSQGKQKTVNYTNNEDGVILNLQDLTSGLFIVRVQTQHGTINRKIIKN